MLSYTLPSLTFRDATARAMASLKYLTALWIQEPLWAGSDQGVLMKVAQLGQQVFFSGGAHLLVVEISVETAVATATSMAFPEATLVPLLGEEESRGGRERGKRRGVWGR